MSNVTIKHVMTRAEINAALDKAEFEGRSFELNIGTAKPIERSGYDAEYRKLYADAAAECKHYHDTECYSHYESGVCKVHPYLRGHICPCEDALAPKYKMCNSCYMSAFELQIAASQKKYAAKR